MALGAPPPPAYRVGVVERRSGAEPPEVAPATLVGVELVWLDLRLRAPVGTSAGAHLQRPLLAVRVVTDQAEGWGECGALPAATPGDPDLDVVARHLQQVAVPRLIQAARTRGGAVAPAALVSHLGGTRPADRHAAATLQMAVLDAELRRSGTPLGARLGVTATSVPVGAVVGIPRDRSMAALLHAVEDVGWAARVRLKIEPGWDVEPVRAVRAAFPDLALQVDANGAYGRLADGGPGAAERLAPLDDLGLTCIEQPLAPPDLAGHAELAARLRTPLGLDESLTSPRRVRDALRYGAMGVACLKPARLGGVFPAVGALGHCREAGVPAFVGGLFEAGPGRAANAVLSALAAPAEGGDPWPGDVAPPAGYLAATPFTFPALQGCRLALPTTPGIGSDLDPAALEGLVARRRWTAA